MSERPLATAGADTDAMSGTSGPSRLRVGLLLCPEQMLRSEVCIRHSLQEAEFVELVIVAVPSTQGTSLPQGWPVLTMHRAADRHIAGSATPREELCEVEPHTLAGLGLDVVIVLHAFEGLALYAQVARLGVWWFAASSSDRSLDNHRILLCSALNGLPVREILWCSDAQATYALDYASARTLSSISVARNREALVPVRRDLLRAALRRASATGGTAAPCRTYPEITEPASLQLAGADAVGLSWDITRTAVRKLYRRLRPAPWKEQYSVGLRRRVHPDGFDATEGYTWLPLRPDSWLADPFLATHEGCDYLFMEQMVEAQRRARIVCTEIDSTGRASAIEPVLERPYHLSYPHVFVHQDDFYMIPESGDAGRVELYRARSFPQTWELVRVLYEGPAFDTSVHYDGDQFWFFTSIIADAAALASQLLLFRAERLDGDWIAHPHNPICADVRFARGAGRIFRSGSRLLRPAQDGSISYGGSMSFRSIEVLTESAYRESPVVAVTLERAAMVGPHTYDRSALHEVIDGRFIVPREGPPVPLRARYG